MCINLDYWYAKFFCLTIVQEAKGLCLAACALS